MRKRTQNTQPAAKAADNDEPIGIVISSGGHDDAVPRVTAYVWGPVPGVETESELVAVA